MEVKIMVNRQSLHPPNIAKLGGNATELISLELYLHRKPKSRRLEEINQFC